MIRSSGLLTGMMFAGFVDGGEVAVVVSVATGTGTPEHGRSGRSICTMGCEPELVT